MFGCCQCDSTDSREDLEDVDSSEDLEDVDSSEVSLITFCSPLLPLHFLEASQGGAHAACVSSLLRCLCVFRKLHRSTTKIVFQDSESTYRHHLVHSQHTGSRPRSSTAAHITQRQPPFEPNLVEFL